LDWCERERFKSLEELEMVIVALINLIISSSKEQK
jgi:hypothetical protein